jgi:hypothetical protein
MLKTKLNDAWYAKKRDGHWYRQIPSEEGKLRYAQLVTNPKMVRRLERQALADLSRQPGVPKSYSTEIEVHGAGPSEGFYFKHLLSPSEKHPGFIDVKVDQFAETKVHCAIELKQLLMTKRPRSALHSQQVRKRQ